MAYRCDICDKKSQAGRQHKHHRGVAGGQWTRRAPHTLRSFRPNLHKVTLEIKGKMATVKACANCIKRIRFDAKKAKEAAAVKAEPAAN